MKNMCKSNRSCSVCQSKHHTLLHVVAKKLSDREVPSNTSTPSTSAANVAQNTLAAVQNVELNTVNKRPSAILLATAVVTILDSKGNPTKCRALLDNGSECNFITEDLCQKLKLKKYKSNQPLAGIGRAQVQSSHYTQCTFFSCQSSFKATLDFLVLPKLTQNLPSQNVDISELKIPEGIELADPNFDISNRIDLIVGSEIFFSLLSIGQINLGPSLPILTKTKLGWIISGPIPPHHNKTKTIECARQSFHVCSVDSQLKKFWEIESVPGKIIHSIEEQKVESIFKSTTVRLADGSYQTDLPFNESILRLGSNKHIATKRFLNLERQLAKSPKMQEEYSNFIKEYVDLGHMTKTDGPSVQEYFLPHHCLIKQNALTTKLRVVFDGSCKTDTGISLNDTLMVGPTVQQDLFSIIMRFRTHKIAVHADIQKMYRMIQVNPSHRQFQKILWRNSPSDPLETYLLNTVTYGTASASFSAIRTLNQLTLDEEQFFSPEIIATVRKDFYVDDLLSGGDDIEQVANLVQEVTKLLSRGSFKLHKWYSNDPNIFSDTATDTVVDIDVDDTIKTLGLLWQPNSDEFIFSVHPPSSEKLTKRIVLSEIGKIFDPLGLINPITLRAKLIMQELWKANLSWDESLPQNLHSSWQEYRRDVSKISSLHVNRKLSSLENPIKYELHGFCDSSELAYGCCFYVVSEDEKGNRSSNLLCGKSRVAPIRKVSLPRLELCGAVLLSELYVKIKESLHNVHFESVHFWSDSQIVLSWIASPSSKFKTFVANRIGEIHSITDPQSWKHVGTLENPADVNTRGIPAKYFLHCSLWFHGPSWLLCDKSKWPCNNATINTSLLPEVKANTTTKVAYPTTVNEFDLIKRYSNFNKLLRVTAYCLRFIRNCRAKSPEAKTSGSLNLAELKNSTQVLVKIVQNQHFSNEIKTLSNRKPVHPKSKILNLNPFLDNDDIIRVGGRVGNSEMSYASKFPIFLPCDYFSCLLLSHFHTQNLHCGIQALIANVRLEYWPLNVKNMARTTVHKCITCYRAKPKLATQLMGNLPKDRVQPSRPFSVSGVDYLGPITVKSGYTRKSPAMKAYVAVFVCFSTKAVHLEVVSDLTARAFIAAFHRFISRRGKPSRIYSDNATNFVGASNEIKRQVAEDATNNGIEWKFIPPNSPHFGGLWEAGVKSVKHYLKRVASQALLNFEEMATLICRVEKILNSRPITSLTEDPNDFSFLTPGHFLIGDSLSAPPERDVTDIQINRLNRWQRVQHLAQNFWSRWSKEYLNQLRQRNKWKSPENSLSVGSLVLIKEDNSPSMTWPIGRVISVNVGKDGHVRVATVKTQSGIFKRCIQKLCPLPVEV